MLGVATVKLLFFFELVTKSRDTHDFDHGGLWEVVGLAAETDADKMRTGVYIVWRGGGRGLPCSWGPGATGGASLRLPSYHHSARM